jgi:uncharacterized radical SAM superfamily Fe-S cluster-containing enzyme
LFCNDLVNGVNNDQVGTIVRFALENPKKISLCHFNPFRLPDATNTLPNSAFAAALYLSHLAQDVQKQVGLPNRRAIGFRFL